jgi:hypothetical protein
MGTKKKGKKKEKNTTVSRWYLKKAFRSWCVQLGMLCCEPNKEQVPLCERHNTQHKIIEIINEI